MLAGLALLVALGVTGGSATPDTATAVVRRYCQLDFDGARLSSESWNQVKDLIAWQAEPGWDTAVVVSSLEETMVTRRGSTAIITVKYDVLGHSGGLDGQEFMAEPKEEMVSFTVYSHGQNWLIERPVIPPHVSPTAMINLVQDLLAREKEPSDRKRRLEASLRSLQQFITPPKAAGHSAGVLAFSAKSSPHSSPFLLKSSRGITYRLSLAPDFDVDGHVITLELVLRGPDKKQGDPNLLDSTGKLHGDQPYDFPASDFAPGAAKSTGYGESRVFELPTAGIEMRVRIAEVHVEPIPGSSPNFPSQFGDLTLDVMTQDLPEKGTDKFVR